MGRTRATYHKFLVVPMAMFAPLRVEALQIPMPPQPGLVVAEKIVHLRCNSFLRETQLDIQCMEPVTISIASAHSRWIP